MAIKFNRIYGFLNRNYKEGWHVKIPWLEWPVIFDVKTQAKAFPSKTGTKDLQSVHISIRVMYRPQVEKLVEIYRQIGRDYDERVLRSIVNEVVKNAIAQYNAAQLLNQREQVSYAIRRSLEERSKEFFIVIDDVSITDLSFSDEFHRAVEEKQSAQQDAERAKFLVEQALQEKKSTIIRAQGQAKSAELIGKAMQNNPSYIELKRIESAKKIAHLLSSSGNRLFLDSNTLLLNIANPMAFTLGELRKGETPLK
jgi:prohibitin 2